MAAKLALLARLWSLCVLSLCCRCCFASPRIPTGVHPLDEKYYDAEQIKCKDGSKFFSRDQLNDDFCDCDDGTDEPGTSACPSGKFYCRNMGSTPKFLFSSRVNDRICDCCDGSDEYDGAVTCPNVCVMGGNIAYQSIRHDLFKIKDSAASRKRKIEDSSKGPPGGLVALILLQVALVIVFLTYRLVCSRKREKKASKRTMITSTLRISQCLSKSRRSTNMATVVEENVKHGNGDDFERVDNELLTSIFSNVRMSPSVSSSSDNNSIKGDENPTRVLEAAQLHWPKIEPEEVLSSCKSDEGLIASHAATTQEGSSGKNVDPKRLKRILANRQYAQRSRLRKLRYIAELEHKIGALQAEVSELYPRVAYLDHIRLLLNADNSALKQRIVALAHDRVLKDAHQEALRSEIMRLGRAYYHQNVETTSSAIEEKLGDHQSQDQT